jgi:hypothetical protein
VLANSRYDPATPPSAYGQWVALPAEDEVIDYALFTGDLVDERLPWHHDSQKLAQRLIEVYAELVATRADRSVLLPSEKPGPSDPSRGGTNVPVPFGSPVIQ